MPATTEELNKLGTMIPEEGEAAPVPAATAAPEAEAPVQPEAAGTEGQDNAVVAPPEAEAEAETDAETPAEEQPGVDPKQFNKGDPRRRIAKLTARAKTAEEQKAFLEAENQRLRSLLPQDYQQRPTQSQSAPVAQPVQQGPDAQWNALNDQQLLNIQTSDDPEVTQAHRAKAAQILNRREALRVAQEQMAPFLQQQKQAYYTQMAMKEYPEVFVEGTMANQLLRQVYASDPRLSTEIDGMLYAAERTMARLAKAQIPALTAANAEARRGLRRAKANASLEAGSPAPSGTPASRARAADLAAVETKKGYDWKKSDTLLNKVNDLL